MFPQFLEGQWPLGEGIWMPISNIAQEATGMAPWAETREPSRTFTFSGFFPLGHIWSYCGCLRCWPINLFRTINWIMSFHCSEFFNGSPWTVKIQTSDHNFEDPMHSNTRLPFRCIRWHLESGSHSSKLARFPLLQGCSSQLTWPPALEFASPAYPLAHHLVGLFQSF